MKSTTFVATLSGTLMVMGFCGSPVYGAISGGGSTNNTVTNSTSSSTVNHNTQVNVNNYNTRVLGLATWTGPGADQCFNDRHGRRRGRGHDDHGRGRGRGHDDDDDAGGSFVNATVFDQSFALPIGSQEVQAAYAMANTTVEQALLSTGGRGQIQISNNVQVNTSTASSTVETGRTSTVTQTTEVTIGPGTVIIGDRDTGGTPFQILAGQSNININTHTQTDIFTTTTTTTNTNTLWTVTGELYSSPIVLDLSNSGTLEASGGKWLPHKNVFNPKHRQLFDFFGNGFPVAMEWVGPHDGLLVKPKADGSVDGSCLFGNANGYNHGYEQLAALDENLDGRVSGKELRGLSVWQDKNGNAKADPGEIRTVGELKITSLDLHHENFKSTFTMNGKTQAMFDWWPTMFEIKKIKQPV